MDSSLSPIWGAYPLLAQCEKSFHSVRDMSASSLGREPAEGASHCDRSYSPVLLQGNQGGTKERRSDRGWAVSPDDVVGESSEGTEKCRASSLCRGSNHVF